MIEQSIAELDAILETLREKVFRRFYRLEASRTTPGSGLGLALVKAVADLHGASVELSDNHPGLRVTVRFHAAGDGGAKERIPRGGAPDTQATRNRVSLAQGFVAKTPHRLYRAKSNLQPSSLPDLSPTSLENRPRGVPRPICLETRGAACFLGKPPTRGAAPHMPRNSRCGVFLRKAVRTRFAPGLTSTLHADYILVRIRAAGKPHFILASSNGLLAETANVKLTGEMMNKKLIAVAVAGAFAAPAVVYAQASTVQIYGRFNFHYVYRDLGASKTGPQGVGQVRDADHLQNRASNIGFKGEENLGGGLAAWFQCESGANFLAGGATLCSRNSALGLKGSFGNFFIGLWDTPYKRVGPLFGTAPFSTAGAFGIGFFLHNGEAGGNNTENVASFSRRHQNLITYDSPNISGFRVMAALSAANEATAQTDGSTLGKRRLYSLGAIYDNGPIHIAGGYERHEGFNPASLPAASINRTATGYSNSLDDDSWQINGAYTFTPIRLKVGAAWARNNYEVNNSQDMHYQAWGVYASWNIAGPHVLRVGYTKAQDTKGGAGTLAAPIIVGQAVANGSAGNTKGELFAVRYAYLVSKRTEANIGIAFIDNDPNARYQFQGLGTASTGPGFQTGFQQRAIVLGAKHSF